MKRIQSLCTAPVLSIFSLALLVRLAYNFTVARGYLPLHDSLTYQNIAYNILQEHCYCLLPHLPTVDRAPLWPIIIAIIYELFARNMLVRLFLCVIGSLTCVLTYFFAKDLFKQRAGIFAGLVAAIYPFLYIYDGWLYSESLYIFLLLAFCYALYRLQHAPSRNLSILSGILLGLLSLTRPNGLLILGLFIVWAMGMGMAKVLTWPDIIRSVVSVLLISLVLVVPWTTRNYVVTNTFVPIATGDGKVLLGAYNYQTADPLYQGGYYAGVWIIPSESTPWIYAQFPQDCAGACEVTRDATYKTAALHWIEGHMSIMPFMIGQHFANIWQTTTQEADLAINRYPDRIASHVVVRMMKIITPIVFALALLGLVVTSDRWRELLFIYLMIAFTIAQCLILYGIPRFRAPIEPMLIILASGAVWWITELLAKSRPKEHHGS